MRAGERPTGFDELDSAETSARKGLELARVLDNAISRVLPSMRSDSWPWQGTTGNVRSSSARRGWRWARDCVCSSRSTLTRLSPSRPCTAGTLSWPSAYRKADLRLLQPGRAPEWGLQLSAWRTLVLQLLGRWDEVEATADRANGMWLESGRPAAGYSMRGWLAALVVARARRDDARIALWAEAIDEIGGQFAFWRELAGALVNWDLEKLAAAVESAPEPASFRFFDVLGLYMSLCNDSSCHFGDAFLTKVLAKARSASALPLEGETLRALGLVRADATLLDQANAIFETVECCRMSRVRGAKRPSCGTISGARGRHRLPGVDPGRGPGRTLPSGADVTHDR